MHLLLLPQQNLSSLTSFNPELALKPLKARSLNADNREGSCAWNITFRFGLCFLFCFLLPKCMSSPGMKCTEAVFSRPLSSTVWHSVRNSSLWYELPEFISQNRLFMEFRQSNYIKTLSDLINWVKTGREIYM